MSDLFRLFLFDKMNNYLIKILKLSWIAFFIELFELKKKNLSVDSIRQSKSIWVFDGLNTQSFLN
jgi:hypothetical protein